MESLTCKGTIYVLQRLKQECDCSLRCSMCYACIHMYSCTCLDATLHSTVCKHIHLLCMQKPKEIENSVSEQKDDTLENESEREDIQVDISNEEKEITEGMETDEQFNTHEYFSKLLHTDPTNDHNFIGSNISDLANEVVSLVQSCHDIDIMKTVKKT